MRACQARLHAHVTFHSATHVCMRTRARLIRAPLSEVVALKAQAIYCCNVASLTSEPSREIPQKNKSLFVVKMGALKILGSH